MRYQTCQKKKREGGGRVEPTQGTIKVSRAGKEEIKKLSTITDETSRHEAHKVEDTDIKRSMKNTFKVTFYAHLESNNFSVCCECKQRPTYKLDQLPSPVMMPDKVYQV